MPRLAADLADLVVHRRPVDRLAVDGEHEVARLEASRLGRGVSERRDDHEATGCRELGAGRQVGGILGVADRHLGTDAAEAARQVAQRLLVLLRGHVARVRILHPVLEHTANGALRQLVGVELVHVLGLEAVIRLTDLRRAMGYVPQEGFLFSGSVLDNIRFGRPEATRAEVEAAARAVGADQVIAGLPDGYDTPVGERGAAGGRGSASWSPSPGPGSPTPPC